MVGSSLCFAVMVLAVKQVIGPIPLPEVVLFRSVLVGLLGAAVGFPRGRLLLGVNRRMLVTRSLLGVASMFAYFEAVALLKLGDAVLLQYLSPLFVTLLAPWALREKSPRGQWLALAFGVAGVACVAGPFGAVKSKGVAVALVSAVLSAGAYVSVKHLALTDPPETIVVWFSAWATLIAALFTLRNFVLPDRRELSWLFVTGIAAGCAQLLMTRAYAAGDAARISIYGYTTPVAAYILGQMVLRERPGFWGIAGTALVVTAGVLVSRRGPAREVAAAS